VTAGGQNHAVRSDAAASIAVYDRTVGAWKIATSRRARAFGLVAVVVFFGLVSGCNSDGGDADASKASSTSTSAPAKPAGALVIAHRGASDFAPEHTFASYDLAIKQGADYLEQDLQLTADGVLVVLHDATLDRTARGPVGSCTGLVAEKTLAQIKQCDVGSWFNEASPEHADPAYVGLRIPTMEQVIDRYGADARYYIELKALDPGSGMAESLLDLLGQTGLLHRTSRSRPVIIQSFGADVLRMVHARRPELPLVQLIPDTGSPVDMTWLDNARGYAVAIGPPNPFVDPALVAAAHVRCLEVHPYTVNDRAEMDRLLQAGVDGMFTNEPEVLRTELEGRPPPPGHCAPAAGEGE
jgi:glycerophosphoryl diester phosphodiesterase